MNLLQDVEFGMGCPDWHIAMHSLRRQRLLWIYSPGQTAHEDRCANRVTTSSLTMEVEAVTQALQWLVSQSGNQITQAIILTD